MIGKILLHIKPASLLITLKSDGAWYISNLAKETSVTYVYATKVLSKFEREGLVKFDNKGRTKLVKLTEKGVEVANILNELFKKLETKE